jgi:hypothetical protein
VVVVNLEIETKPSCYVTSKGLLYEVRAAEYHLDYFIVSAFELARWITLAKMDRETPGFANAPRKRLTCVAVGFAMYA